MFDRLVPEDFVKEWRVESVWPATESNLLLVAGTTYTIQIKST